MRILIFAGGTGSVALQRGLYNALDTKLDGVDTKIIVNAYDNGRSTGVVRRVMDGEILGPSDVRKNQTTRLQLRNPTSPWLSVLAGRFSSDSANAEEVCNRTVIQLKRELERQGYNVDCCSILFNAIAEYFSAPLAAKVDYTDFSFANIIYAGLAKANGRSLRAAATIMAAAMGIPDNILLNDDNSLFLGAITQSGERISDEGDIVCWGNEADPFVDIFFSDASGNIAEPELCAEARRAILEADLIVLSPGTQWSSLIPTYASHGFKNAVNDTQAKVLMIMNRTPDTDSPGQSASDIIDILVPRYFDVGRLHVLADTTGHPKMRNLAESAIAKVASFTTATLSTDADPPDQHNSGLLSEAVGCVLFKEYLDSDFYLFDYDDTLVGRNDWLPKSSQHNVNGIARLNLLTDIGLCTGNTIKAISIRRDTDPIGDADDLICKPLLVFADGGVNKYSLNTQPVVDAGGSRSQFLECIAPNALLGAVGPYSANMIVERLHSAGVPLHKIDNRGDVIVAIKPIQKEDRSAFACWVERLLYGSMLEIRKSGTTTVEICKPLLAKTCALQHLRKTLPPSAKITYVGDELESGNDHDIRKFADQDKGVKCLQIGSPATTGFFIFTLISHLAKNVRH